MAIGNNNAYGQLCRSLESGREVEGREEITPEVEVLELSYVLKLRNGDQLVLGYLQIECNTYYGCY